MEFDLEYRMENLKERATEFFDENGKAYTANIFSLDFAEIMWEMVKELEERVIYLEDEVSGFVNGRP
ncbi:MAG: hypothetical protein IPH58_05450 [Sphingobacteriales bacterium]|jgi:hypothetical protein|nr:hypothetical protein [Sphingobacteriales bacterium]